MILKSIRWRIQIWHTLLLASIVATLLFAFYRHQKEITYRELDQTLREPIVSLLPILDRFDRDRPAEGREGREGRRRPPPHDLPAGFRPPPRRDRLHSDRRTGTRQGPERHSRMTANERIKFIAEGLANKDCYVIAWPAEGDPFYRSENCPPDVPARPEPTRPGNRKRTISHYHEIYHSSPRRNTIVVGTDLRPIQQELSRLTWRLTGIGGAIVAGGILVGWFLTGNSLRPIQRISKTAQKIAEGDLSRRIITADTHSELGELASTLNNTFDKLENSFEQQIRFTADASHEMRTPIAVILAKSQFALSRDRPAEKYQEALRTCLNSAQHMRSLIESLLELSRVDSGRFEIHREEGDLALLVQETAQMLRPLAEERGITIETDLTPSPNHFDHQRMRQVLINLLSNAVKYNHENGTIFLTLSQENGQAAITIRDTGPGISPSHIPHLFDRFYRIDQARSTNKEGSTGLGLAITKAIIEAHGAQISVLSKEGQGATFTISGLSHSESDRL